MKWVKFKRWQKGALIGILIGLIVTLVILINDFESISNFFEGLLTCFIFLIIPLALIGAYIGFLGNSRYKLIGALVGCVIIISSFFTLFILQSNLDDCFKERSSIIHDRCIEQVGCDPADRSNPSCGPGIGQCTTRITLEECSKTTAGTIKKFIISLFGGEKVIDKISETGPLVIIIYPMYILIWGAIGSFVGALVGFLLRNKKYNPRVKSPKF